MDIILWLYYTIVRLIVVLGVVFLDYLIYLSMKESIFLKTKAVLRKIAWVGIMIISLVILQGVPVLSENLLQDRCTTLIQNMDLQLIVLFYFLHMLKRTMMLHFNVFVSIAITFYYIAKFLFHARIFLQISGLFSTYANVGSSVNSVGINVVFMSITLERRFLFLPFYSDLCSTKLYLYGKK